MSDYQDSFVSFIDILGFKSLVKQNEYGKVLDCLKLVKEVADFHNKHAGDDGFVPSVSAFSDSIFITVPSESKWGAHSICYLSGYLSKALLERGVLSRGAITRGKVYHNDGIAFGPGLIDAYELESSVSFYPRVIVDSYVEREFYKNFDSNFENKDLWANLRKNRYFFKDRDGCSYLDIFDSFYAHYYASGEYCFSDDDRKRYKYIIDGFLKSSSGHSRHSVKVQWMLDFFEKSCRRHPNSWKNSYNEMGRE